MKVREIAKNYEFIRRIVMFSVLFLLLLQFVRSKILVGSLTGSLLFSWLTLLDPFAFLEIQLASRSIDLNTINSVLPVVGIYLIFGRAFCGWICPMDFFFRIINKIKFSLKVSLSHKIPSNIGYLFFFIFLFSSFMLGIPIFTNYLSHLTNLFRGITGLYFLIFNMPVEFSTVLYSIFFILVLLILEFFFPNLWCRIICPIGRLYGALNKISLLHLRFDRDKCLNCQVCNKSCYMGIDIMNQIKQGKLRSIDCIFCGRCIQKCSQKGNVINFKLGV